MARQLANLDIIAPGRLGINREERSRLLNPEFATKATNFVINREGLLASRKGRSDQTTTAITATPNIETMHERITAAGNTEVIVAWDGGIANSIDNPEGNDISGSLTDTNGTWWMQDFNDKTLAFQSGQKLAVYSGSTFATVTESGGTAPTSGIAGTAFGRVWQVDNADGANLKYCGLLDETDWNGTGAGSIDFSNIWTNGQDRITAIVGFNGVLVVFGMRHIVFISDGTGSELGLNPNNAYVSDVIQGTGCVDQQTIQPIGETDLLYLSPNGLQSLSRVIQERSNPTQTLSKLIRTELLTAYRGATAGTIRSTYSPDEGFYLISFPASNKTYCFLTRKGFQDEDGDLVFPVFEWDFAPTSMTTRENGDTLFGEAGEVFKYSGTTDNGADIALEYESSWLDFGEEIGNRLKILKKISAIIFSSLNSNIVFKWYTDFRTTASNFTKSFTSSATGAEWGVAEWGLDEWGGGGAAQKIFSIAARGTGQYFKIGFTAAVDVDFAVQQLELKAKVGRIA
jgi:hypothetical protein